MRGNSIDLEGTHLQEVLPDLYRQTIEVTARVGADQDDPHLSYDHRVIGVCHECHLRDESPREIGLRREKSRRCTATDGVSRRLSNNLTRCSGWK